LGASLAIATAIVFCISSAFPAVAAFVKDTESWPKWWGVLDVGIAFLVAMLAFAVIGLARQKVGKQAEDESYRVYRILIHGIILMLGVFFLLGDRIVWSNCLTGIAWRTWLLLYGTRMVCRVRRRTENGRIVKPTTPRESADAHQCPLIPINRFLPDYATSAAARGAGKESVRG
jgi:hypothetical protein